MVGKGVVQKVPRWVLGVPGGGTEGSQPAPRRRSPPGTRSGKALNLLPGQRLVLIGCLAFRLRRAGPLSLLA